MPVAVGIADWRRGRCNHDSLGAQPVEHRENRVLHRVAAHDRIVEDDERVILLDEPVGNVVDVLVELAPRRGVRDERAELRVLDDDLAKARDIINAEAQRRRVILDRIYRIDSFFGAWVSPERSGVAEGELNAGCAATVQITLCALCGSRHSLRSAWLATKREPRFRGGYATLR